MARSTLAFTLVELLVVVAIIAALLGLLVPSLSTAREVSRTAVCGSNIRQVTLANIGYAVENRGTYVRAAANIYVGFGGTQRWHGERASAGVSADPDDNYFDPDKGPLVRYLGKEGRVKACPSFGEFVTDGALNAFESGTGGFGYNHQYVGGRYDKYGNSPAGAANSARDVEVTAPSDTVMFTDAAFFTIVAGTKTHIEYSFAHAPYHHLSPGAPSTSRASPSIHFRHLDRCNVAWVAGHVTTRAIDFNKQSITGGTEVEPEVSLGLGWFGPDDNSFFDLD